jgi:hypothetical protein
MRYLAVMSIFLFYEHRYLLLTFGVIYEFFKYVQNRFQVVLEVL